MDVKELRQEMGLTQKAFGEFFGIPPRTIQNWEGGVRKCPDYVLELMRFKAEHTKKDGQE